jgi:hypothetical protein
VVKIVVLSVTVTGKEVVNVETVVKVLVSVSVVGTSSVVVTTEVKVVGIVVGTNSVAVTVSVNVVGIVVGTVVGTSVVYSGQQPTRSEPWWHGFQVLTYVVVTVSVFHIV